MPGLATIAGMHPTDPALQHLIARIRAAAVDQTPLRIRGGGSKDFYGAHAASGRALVGEVLDTTALTGIVSYEPSELVVTVRAGTPLAEVEAALAEQNQCLPFEPPHFRHADAQNSTGPGAPQGRATIGGMVAAGLAGPARASVGGVRDYVLGVQMVNGRGEHLTFGGQVIKNVAGYDVSRLMVSAMGTLGLLTEISLKVLPVAPAEATLVFEMDQATALAQLHRWGGQPLPLNASCWVRDTTAPGAAVDYGLDLLFVRLRGAAAAVDAACATLLAQHSGTRMDNTQAKADWALCRDQQLPFFTEQPSSDCALWRLSVAQTAPAFNLPWPQLVEWHGGLRWLWAPASAGAQLQALAQAHGGSATIFIAACARSMRADGLFDTKNAALDAIQRRLKTSFDPHGIFNPGRLNDAF
jgi:glycolate oxidase FAD binding subunit